MRASGALRNTIRPRTASMTMPLAAATSPLSAVDPYAEDRRLQALQRYDILDTPREEAFDRITRLAQKIFRVPVAIVSFADAHRQWHKAAEGTETVEVPREQTFCRHVVASGEPLVVSDARLDTRFDRNPHVTCQRGVRFYVGLPLKTRDRHVIGVLCLIDYEPREFTPAEAEMLADLGQIAMDELELRQSVARDALTGAMSRKSFKEEIVRAAAQALRHHQDLSLIAIDLDHFKDVNDTFGHSGGDVVLVNAAEACMSQLRAYDVFGRLGGEEFAALLANTGHADAMCVANRCREVLAGREVRLGERRLRVTGSFGIASLGPSLQSADALLEHADKALYEAKRTGRNRCVAWRDMSGAVPSPHRRVLKAGRIEFNGGTSTVDCTVRGLSDAGATIAVSHPIGIPRVFTLAILADGFRRPCRILESGDRRLEVVFT